MTEKKKEKVEIWDRIWTKARVEQWDELSETIYRILSKVTMQTRDKLILEAGSGTGRISLRLKKEDKGNVVLLDISKTAVQLSKKFFEEQGQTGFFIQGSALEIPIKGDSIDIVWNAGVLEHFRDNERIQLLKEMARICKDTGFIITFNPYSKAIFYRIGKYVSEKRKRWIYGYEQPVKSLTQYAIENRFWITEYSVGFNTSIDFLSSIPYSRYFLKMLRKLSRKLPQFLSNHFGYLLVSISVKAR